MSIQATIEVQCAGRMAESVHQDLARLYSKYMPSFFDDLHDPVLHWSSPSPLSRLMGVKAGTPLSTVTFKVTNFDCKAIEEFASVLSSDSVTASWGNRSETVDIEPRRDLVEELLKDLSDNPGGRVRR